MIEEKCFITKGGCSLECPLRVMVDGVKVCPKYVFKITEEAARELFTDAARLLDGFLGLKRKLKK